MIIETPNLQPATNTDFIFLGSKITMDVTAAMKLKDSCPLEEKLWQN